MYAISGHAKAALNRDDFFDTLINFLVDFFNWPHLISVDTWYANPPKTFGKMTSVLVTLLQVGSFNPL